MVLLEVAAIYEEDDTTTPNSSVTWRARPEALDVVTLPAIGTQHRERTESAIRALVVVCAASAAMFLAIVGPFVVAVTLADRHNRSAETRGPPVPTTLASLPPSTCHALDAADKAGISLFETIFPGRTDRTGSMIAEAISRVIALPRNDAQWPQRRQVINAALVRYERTVERARREVPASLQEEMRRVLVDIRRGRADLDRARSSRDYAERVSLDALNGATALADLSAKVGSACGTELSLLP